MWWCAAFLFVMAVDGVSVAVVDGLSPEDLSSSSGSVHTETVLSPITSPLEHLLAAAAGSTTPGVSPIVFPLAAGQRNKRKPQRFRPKSESRFRPKSVKKEDIELIGKAKLLQDQKASTIKSRFSGFPRRPSPGPVKQITIDQENDITYEEVNDPVDQTTSPPQPGFFGSPEPVNQPNILVSQNPIFNLKSSNPIPLAISNDLSSGPPFDQTVLFEKLQSLTGAQPVGVTSDIAQPVEQTVEYRDGESRRDQARQLSGQAGRGRSGVRRGANHRVAQEQRVQEVRKAAPLPSRRKKSNFVQKKSKKVKVGTVERYRYENEDGSITWGYENDDGGFKEETIGMDCITHGKYGYTDPSGEVREYSYTTGIRCDPDTRQVKESESGRTGTRGPNGHGFYDYSQNKFVMPDGRRVTVVVNQGNKARGRRY